MWSIQVKMRTWTLQVLKEMQTLQWLAMASIRCDLDVDFTIIEGIMEVAILGLIPIGNFKIMRINHENHDWKSDSIILNIFFVSYD